MTDNDQSAAETTPLEAVQNGWQDLQLRIRKLEAAHAAVEQENKALRHLMESVIAHRQKSHSELVLLLTTLVSKLQINDVGLIISKLVEHNTNVSQYLAALAKGTTAEAPLPAQSILETMEQAKKDLAAAVGREVQELMRMETPIEPRVLEDISRDPETFFAPPAIRTWRCYVKGQVPRERVVREFGEPSLCCFRDMTTDPRLNPRPKPDEIVLAFRDDAENALAQESTLDAQTKEKLIALQRRVQASKSSQPEARAQRATFQKLSFFVELLHYYEHQNTEPADVTFAQRLPSLIEQLAAAQDELEEGPIRQCEELLGHIINPDHRQMVVNNVGKGGGVARTLKYVLTFRMPNLEAPDSVAVEFVRHLLPAQGGKTPAPGRITPILRLVPEPMQKVILRALSHSDRLRRDEADALTKAVSAELGIQSLDEDKAQQALLPEVDREMAWTRIRDMISQRANPTALATAIRDRLNSHYDSEEIRQSWMVLTETDPMSFIRVFCQFPYLPNGKTDPIAKPVMESYLTRLVHEKYAATYHRVTLSLKNIFRTKPDSPTLLTFMALVKWASPEAAARIASDVGMPTQ